MLKRYFENARRGIKNNWERTKYANNDYFWISPIVKMIMIELKPELNGKDLSENKM